MTYRTDPSLQKRDDLRQGPIHKLSPTTMATQASLLHDDLHGGKVRRRGTDALHLKGEALEVDLVFEARILRTQALDLTYRN